MVLDYKAPKASDASRGVRRAGVAERWWMAV